MYQSDLGEFSSTGTECPTCGKRCASETGVNIHHAKTHGESIALETATCVVCGCEFDYYPGKRDGLYCGRECKVEGQRLYNTVACTWCGDEFEKIPAEVERNDHHFCSDDCESAWRSENFSGKDSPRWVNRITVVCGWCGSDVEKTEAYAKRVDDHFCDLDCFGAWASENRRGIDHPNWRAGGSGGMTDAVRNLLGNENWVDRAAAVRDRDSRCQLCGVVGSGRALHAHHIVPLVCGGTNSHRLLMALCGTCHTKAERYTREFLDPVLVDWPDGE